MSLNPAVANTTEISRGVALLVVILSLLTTSVSAADSSSSRIPVLAWGGPPASETNITRYRELADAGFTHNFSSFPDAASMAAALDIAAAAGIQQFISLPELEKDPEEIARRFKDHPALGGYYLRDEPSAKDFSTLAKWATRIRAIDPEHPIYVNLLPNYATPAQLGTESYQEHLDRFVAEVPVSFVSFDHYPVVGDTLRPEWYENLERVAATATKVRKPFWAFALAVAHGPYPIPTLEQLRLQVFSNLAYGAQGIQFFTYWTFESTEWNFHEAPINTNGVRTPTFERVQQVNAEIRALSGTFHGAHVLHLGHTGTLPSGTRKFEPQAPIATIDTADSGALVSLLAKGEHRSLIIVNRDLRSAMPLSVTLDGSLPVSEVRKEGTTKPIEGQKFSAQVGPGDLVVLMWKVHQ